MRDASDELAVRNGCWFNWKRASYTVWWIERFCMLYEGSYAGQPMRLRGLHSIPLTWDVPRHWNDETQAIYQQRMLDYLDCREAGEACDWQYEFHMRLYGWVRWSDHWNEYIRRFRSGSAWVPKKSKKSPSLSANALYVACGDGEPGNHVGLAAKDGNQVRENMATHILEMIRNSPELQKECKVWLNTYKVLHNPTRSSIIPFSSSNERTSKSKEGFNGSIFVDETHVVDWELIGRIDRAGISRKQPLHLEFSTAGDNPDGYGKDRYEYCERVQNGQAEDDTHLSCIHAADQSFDIRSATDDQILVQCIKANPALGHTVELGELLKDIKRSCRNAAEAAKCMKYRLNIWQTSASPWIPAHVWDACGTTLDVSDYRDQYAIVGFDKSSTRDFSAFVVGIPEIGEAGLEKLTLFPRIIACRAYLNAHRHDMPKWQEWAERGLLKVSPGEKIDVGFLMSQFDELTKIFDMKVLGYDPHRAEELTQIISEGLTAHDGRTLFEGYDIPRVSIGMQGAVLANAIDEFENYCIDGKIVHGNHDVMNWMMGNVLLKQRAGLTRIEKPGKDSVRKIDGPMAGVICFAVALNPEFQPESSVYDHRGVLYL